MTSVTCVTLCTTSTSIASARIWRPSTGCLQPSRLHVREGDQENFVHKISEFYISIEEADRRVLVSVPCTDGDASVRLHVVIHTRC